MDYKQYLASREWRVKRREFLELAGNNCQRCSVRPIENIHHLTYENIGNEFLCDLLGVCRPCHEYLTAERDDDPAIEVIKGFIDKYGLSPAKFWPGTESWPWVPLESKSPDHESALIMTIVSENDYKDFMSGQPRMQVGPGVMAIFYWL